jgi:hypothetical protein
MKTKKIRMMAQVLKETKILMMMKCNQIKIINQNKTMSKIKMVKSLKMSL